MLIWLNYSEGDRFGIASTALPKPPIPLPELAKI